MTKDKEPNSLLRFFGVIFICWIVITMFVFFLGVLKTAGVFYTPINFTALTLGGIVLTYVSAGFVRASR